MCQEKLGKICNICQEWYPASDEFWQKEKLGRLGYRPACKFCEQKIRKGLLVRINTHSRKNGLKRCCKCDQYFPATIEYFHPKQYSRPEILKSLCRDCERNESRERARNTHGYKPRESIRENGLKRCSYCRKWKPANSQNYYNSASSIDGLSYACKHCHSRITRNWQARNKQKMLEATRRWRNRNPEKKRLSNKLSRIRNSDKVREAYKRWVKNNPERIKANY